MPTRSPRTCSLTTGELSTHTPLIQPLVPATQFRTRRRQPRQTRVVKADLSNGSLQSLAIMLHVCHVSWQATRVRSGGTSRPAVKGPGRCVNDCDRRVGGAGHATVGSCVSQTHVSWLELGAHPRARRTDTCRGGQMSRSGRPMALFDGIGKKLDKMKDDLAFDNWAPQSARAWGKSASPMDSVRSG